ncbi:MAG: TerB family tellurite resistance protein, partial [Myxococcota bacterium]
MGLLKFLGIEKAGSAERGETETVRRIAGQLERLPADKAKFLASFAYVLARIAHADREIDDSEIEEMERIVKTLAHLSEPEAVLVVQIAKSQAQLLGGTENYVVTREFRKNASKEQRGERLE